MTRAIRLGDGSQMPATGVVPDIDVEVSRPMRKFTMRDPFAVPQVGIQAFQWGIGRSPAQINRCAGQRYGEAELVRDRRQGPPADGRLRHASELNLKFPSFRMRLCCALSIC